MGIKFSKNLSKFPFALSDINPKCDTVCDFFYYNGGSIVQFFLKKFKQYDDERWFLLRSRCLKQKEKGNLNFLHRSPPKSLKFWIIKHRKDQKIAKKEPKVPESDQNRTESH